MKQILEIEFPQNEKLEKWKQRFAILLYAFGVMNENQALKFADSSSEELYSSFKEIVSTLYNMRLRSKTNSLLRSFEKEDKEVTAEIMNTVLLTYLLRNATDRPEPRNPETIWEPHELEKFLQGH